MSPRKRPYSTDFTAHTPNPRFYHLGKIPPTLWDAARKKAAREHISMRALILGLIDRWLHRPVPAALLVGPYERQLATLTPEVTADIERYVNALRDQLEATVTLAAETTHAETTLRQHLAELAGVHGGAL